MVKKTHLEPFYARTAIVTVFLLLFFLAVTYRLFRLQILQGARIQALAESQHSIYRKLLPSRGEIKITDKFSNTTYPVATNIKHFLVYAVPGEIKNPNLAAESLGSVLALDPKDILPKLTDKNKKYAPLKRQLTEQEQEKIKKLQLPGIYFDSEEARFYPDGNLLSQVLGFVGYNKDSKRLGLYGLEKSFETDLAGKAGSVLEEKDTAGAWIFGGKRDVVPEQDGVNLVLTIDKTIQFKAESLLKDAVSKHGADSGCIIVVNPKTGAILAMAGFPDFNPNEYNKAESPSVYTNEATVGNYEPGSTFKAITMAAAVDAGKISADSTYTDTGSVVIDGYTIKNSDLKAHGVQTMTQVLEESLNTGAIYAKEQIGNGDFFKYVKAFGFGEKTGVELPETKGNLDNLKANIGVNYDTATFGQGISVTPLQMVEAYTAFANNGNMMKPYIVQSKISADGKTVNTNPQIVSQVISQKTANVLSAMLVGVVENGHGKKASVPGYYIAGKTGTAQVARRDGKPGYEANNNIGSFIGFGPVENPEFVMLVRIDHPRDVSFAETTAAPTFGELAKFILNYYNIPPTRDTGAHK
jgi:stage V sporulation protein D (sporulation-specific penicillin-binding protein)